MEIADLGIMTRSCLKSIYIYYIFPIIPSINLLGESFGAAENLGSRRDDIVFVIWLTGDVYVVFLLKMMTFSRTLIFALQEIPCHDGEAFRCVCMVGNTN